jgi:hypothetical protein
MWNDSFNICLLPTHFCDILEKALMVQCYMDSLQVESAPESPMKRYVQIVTQYHLTELKGEPTFKD